MAGGRQLMNPWIKFGNLFRIKWRARGGPKTEWKQCPKCRGFGMVHFNDLQPFAAWEFDFFSIEQLRAKGVGCNVCGGRESIPVEDDRR